MFRLSRQKGMAALMIAVTILAIITIITLFTARIIVTDNKIYKNVKDSAYAFNAAQAGLDYALGYLNSHVATVITALSYCNVDTNTYSLPEGTLPNAAYTMRYQCSIVNNTDLLSITAIGVATNSAATRTITATVKLTGGAFANYPVIARTNNGLTNSVDIQDASQIINDTAGAIKTIAAGGTVRLRNSAATITSALAPFTCAANRTMPPAPPTTTCKDIAYNNAILNGMSIAQFETAFLGGTISSFATLAPVYNINCSTGANKIFRASTTFLAAGCTNSGSGGVNGTLAGITGAVIYLNMGSRNLTITTNAGNPSFTLGSAVSPVILVINTTGRVTIDSASSGQSMTINGNVYANSPQFTRLDESVGGATVLNGILLTSGEGQVRGGATVNGVFVANQVNMQTRVSTIRYTPANIDNTYQRYYGSALSTGTNGLHYYGIVAGSWKDF